MQRSRRWLARVYLAQAPADAVAVVLRRFDRVAAGIMGAMAQQSPAARRRILPTSAYGVVMLVLLAIVVLMPFALASIIGDVADSSARVFVLDPLLAGDGESGAWLDVHLQVIALNEWDGTASIRVSLHEACDPACPWGNRVQLISAFGDTEEQQQIRRPSSATVSLPATQRDVAQVVQLPIYGDPIRYPFDSYLLGLGIVVEHLPADRPPERLSPKRAREYAGVTLQARSPRAVMSDPVVIDEETLHRQGDVEPYLVVEEITFRRPTYIKVLTLLLVMLVTAAAAYAVFMRPLDQLIINAGALILGVWGVRAILLGTVFPGVTLVDLALIVVILVLLVTITVRTLYLLEEKSAVKLLRRKGLMPAEPPSPGPGTPPDLVPPPPSSRPDTP